MAGTRPDTDKVGLEERLRTFASVAPIPGAPSWNNAVANMVALADALAVTRNTLSYGLPGRFGTMQRNYSMMGEQRKRPYHSAVITQQSMDVALYATATLVTFAIDVPRAIDGADVPEVLTEHGSQHLSGKLVSYTVLRKGAPYIGRGERSGLHT